MSTSRRGKKLSLNIQNGKKSVRGLEKMKTSELIKLLSEYVEKGDPEVVIHITKSYGDADVMLNLYEKKIAVKLSSYLNRKDNKVTISVVDREGE